MAVVAAFNLA